MGIPTSLLADGPSPPYLNLIPRKHMVDCENQLANAWSPHIYVVCTLKKKNKQTNLKTKSTYDPEMSTYLYFSKTLSHILSTY